MDEVVVETDENQQAEEFITVYINQPFDKEQLNQKESCRGDSSLDLAISDITALKSEFRSLSEHRSCKCYACRT